MYNFKVGGHFSPTADKGEGAYFETDGNGLTLVYNFIRPTEKEIAAVSACSYFQVRYLEMGGVLWILSKAGGLKWIDAPYSPHLSLDVVKLQRPTVPNEGLLLMLIMTDAEANTIKHLRAMGLGHRFSCDLYDQIQELHARPFDSSVYDNNVKDICARYSTDDLVKMSSKYCKVTEGDMI